MKYEIFLICLEEEIIGKMKQGRLPAYMDPFLVNIAILERKKDCLSNRHVQHLNRALE